MAKDTNKAQPHPDKGVSRRDFLRGSAAAGALSSGLLANNVSEAGVAQEERPLAISSVPMLSPFRFESMVNTLQPIWNRESHY